MDGQRFDDFTRQLARGVSRRRVLKGLAGGAVGALAGLRGRPSVDAAQRVSCGNVVCTGQPEVCSDGCVCCVWSNNNSRCMASDDCSRLNGNIEAPCEQGQTRCNGECIDENACCPVCDNGIPCINDACCTSGVYDTDAELCCNADEKVCDGACIAAGACCTDSDCPGNEQCGPQGCFCDTSANALCGETCCAAGDVCCDSGEGCVDNCCPQANLCHGDCVTDYDADPNNCGGCDNACDPDWTCVGGTCTPPCDDTGRSCGGDGDCCSGSTCSDGMCCASGLTNCNGSCVDTTNDTDYCGSCYGQCYPPNHSQSTCVDSACGYICDQGYTDCGYGICADTQSDPNNCGACGGECPEPLHATATCSGGRCGITCEDGYDVCGDFCCLSTLACCNDVCCGEGGACDTTTGECTVQCGALQAACGTSDDCCPSFGIACGVDVNDDNICCHEPGGACSSDADCCVVDGLEVSCQDGVCGAAGAYCEGYEACAYGDCCYGTCCAGNQTCTDTGCKLYEGESCSKDSECESGLCCDSICAEDQDPNNCGACGVVCDADEECYGDQGCLKQAGATCSADPECAPGYKCLDGFCCTECGGYCGSAGSHPAADNTTCTYYSYPTNREGICCSGECLDPSGDSSNCGTCGHTCPLGDSCSGGSCSCTQASPCGTTHYCRDGGLCSALAEGGLACLYIDPRGCGASCTTNADCSGGQVCGTLGCCGKTCNYVD